MASVQRSRSPGRVLRATISPLLGMLRGPLRGPQACLLPCLLPGLLPGLLLGLLAGQAHAQKTVTLRPETSAYRLGRHLQYLRDNEGELSLEQVKSPAIAQRFTDSQVDVPNFGMTTATFWFRFELLSRFAKQQKLLLEVGGPLHDTLEVFIEESDGRYSRTLCGDKFPYGRKLVRHRNFIFPLEILPGQRKRIYLRVQNEGAMQVALTLRTPHAFLEHTNKENLAYGVYFGLLLLILLYNLFLFLSIRDRSYFLYVLYILGSLVYQSSLEGLAQEILWPASPWWGNMAVPFSIGATILSVVLFTQDFLRLGENLPRWNRIFFGIDLIAAASMIGSFFLSYNVVIRLVATLAVPSAILCLLASILTWRRGFRPARLYLAAWFAWLLGGILIALSRLGAIPRTPVTENAHLVGFALNAMLFSFALADRINVMKRQREQAQAEALQIQRRAAETLQDEVDKKTVALQRRTRELSEAYDRLAEHDRLKSTFFANVSHELRSPLGLILTPIERLMGGACGSLPEPVKDRLRSMAGNIQRLLRLINQLLDFSRLESGVMQPTFDLVHAGALVSPIVEAFEPLARSKRLRLEIRTTGILPKIYTDQNMLDKIMTNILSNACKFTEPGGAVVVRLDTDDDHLRIAVRDTGIGISEQDLPWIFERFHQASGGASRRFEGTGIGLALSKELTELIGGTLSVESELGAGSVFEVVLPLGSDHLGPTHEPPQQPSEERTAADDARAAAAALMAETGILDQKQPAEPHLSPEPETSHLPLVLIVEDNPQMRALVAEICSEDFQVLQAADGQEALEQLAQHRPALVISDVMMPRMDGHELIDRIRSNPTTASLPVMLLTAKAGAEMRLDGLESGADDYLVKPFEARELRARALNLVRLQLQESELRALSTTLQREVVRQAADLERTRMLGKFLPPDVVRVVMEEESHGVQVWQQRKTLTIFRLELRGFDEISAQVEPEDLATMLNSHLSEMMEVAFEHGATVDKFVQDSIQGFFGAPKSDGVTQDALRCARMAIKMKDRAARVCEQWKELVHLPPPSPVVVLATGESTVGYFGSSKRLDYTAVGGPINQTQDLLPLVAANAVSCSQDTWELIHQEIECHLLGDVTLPHQSQPLKIYRIGSPPEQMEGAPLADLTAASTTVTPIGIPVVPPVAPPVAPTAGAPGGAPGDAPGVSPADVPPAVPELDLVYEEFRPGALLAGRYRIIRPIGEGSLGTLFQVRDIKLSIDLALRLLPPKMTEDRNLLDRLFRMARLARLVTHPNIARIYDIVEGEGYEFLTMEYVEGKTLASHLKQRGPLPLHEGLDLLRQICAGLVAAHASGLVHGYVNPANIMLEDSGRLVILNLGISKWDTLLMEAGSDSLQYSLGNPHFMSPEQFVGGQVDHRADIYALGAIAFELFCGKRVFEAANVVDLARRHTMESPPDPLTVRPEIPPRLAAVILKCLDKSPQRRFDSVSEIISMLNIDELAAADTKDTQG